MYKGSSVIIILIHKIGDVVLYGYTVITWARQTGGPSWPVHDKSQVPNCHIIARSEVARKETQQILETAKQRVLD